MHRILIADDESSILEDVYKRQLYHYSLTCNHCASPACVANCPSGAMQKDPDDGTVFIDYTCLLYTSRCV